MKDKKKPKAKIVRDKQTNGIWFVAQTNGIIMRRSCKDVNEAYLLLEGFHTCGGSINLNIQNEKIFIQQ